MADIVITARAATTFTAAGALDEDAMGAHLQRLVDQRIGVLLGSCGSGEGGSLTRDELKRVYEIGVSVGKGKVLVGSNQPEQFTARNSIEHAQLAIDAGVDLVNIYGPYGLHGYRPTDQEYLRYFDRILAEISHPVSLCPHASLGYSPKPTVLAAIADKYPQVRTIILSGITGDAYLVELLDAVHRDIEIIVRYDGAFNTLGLGAHGIDVQEANFVPATVRHYIDAYQDGRFSAALESYAALKRLTKINERWRPSSARWIKMALKVFRLPGGDGGVREPYLMPDRAERELFTTSVLALGIPEIDEMARAAGLA